MHKAEPIVENEIHTILWNFEIQKEHPILAGRPDRVLIKKKKKKEFVV